ncbi:hypothetical protein [Bacillus thuringiensis]|uniref:hypothetical protein n=1 Tax=Bacillus thuringiensis TaxID=1428 RepID=UPI0026E16344|nr:hypothetical protein [Bacillus thuringiensis]MDO6628843.1 hypothetical protein [Bacillus thuringiensis]MDO6659237.1 hypothetical protein [Bacillus thuringiensis]MDO6698819.1 hypothetical protein [Bacillus thuringiensis]
MENNVRILDDRIKIKNIKSVHKEGNNIIISLKVDINVTDYIKDALVKALEDASKDKQLIQVHEYMRQIGKTAALIEFAKKHDYYVIVHNVAIAKELSLKFNYAKVTGSLMNLKEVKGVVVDETVDVTRVYDEGINVITGFKC